MKKIPYERALHIIDMNISNIESIDNNQSLNTVRYITNLRVELQRLRKIFMLEHLNNPREYTCEEINCRVNKIADECFYETHRMCS